METVFSFFQNENGSAWRLSDYKMSEYYFYYLLSEYKDISESNIGDPTEYSLRRVDVEQGTEEELLRIETSSCSLVAANDQQLIFSQTEVDPSFSYENYDQEELKKLRESSYTKIFLWEEGTESPELLVEGSRKEFYGAISVVGNNLLLLYYQDSSPSQTLKRMDLNSGELEDLFSLPKEIISYSVLENGYLHMKYDDNQQLLLFNGEGIEEISNKFLPSIENISSIEVTKAGYVVNRITEKVETGPDSFQVKSTAYSFISKEDAAQGRKNYTDFYTETFE